MGQITAAGLFGKYNDPFIRLNAVELINTRSINASVEDQAMEDISASGDAVDAAFLPGRNATTLEVAFWQSIYSGENDLTVQAAMDGKVSVLLEVQLEASGAGTPAPRNPVYKFTGFVSSYTKFDAEHDATLGASMTFQVTGTPERDITP